MHCEGPHILWQERALRGRHALRGPTCAEGLALHTPHRKLGQILATKTEMLPLPYTQSLSGLLDKLPAVPFTEVGGLKGRVALAGWEGKGGGAALAGWR